VTRWPCSAAERDLAIAKVINVNLYDCGFLSFNLVTRGVAESIAKDASSKTYIAPLGAFYQQVVLPNWGFFGSTT
jgi:hypothetical protein